MFAPTYPINLTNYQAALQQFPALFTPRPIDSHKGTFGTLGLIGGSAGMSGALVLAATAAIYNGCGKVWAGFQQATLPMPLIADRPEIMLATANILQQREDISAWVCGCGLGLQAEAAHTVQQQLLLTSAPLLLDADALTLIAQSPELAQAAYHYPDLIITPHPAEAARLLNTTTAQIQANRMAAVRQLAEKFQCVAVLKGYQTLVALPHGQAIYQNHSGNAGLATAGSGDVLCGMIGALLAQGLTAYEAACSGVWLHGAAADILRANHQGEMGMLAGEIAAAARWLRNRLIAG